MVDMLISVIITTYNRAAILKEALTAIENQTLSLDKYEVIVIDDGSKDATKKIVKEMMNKFDNIRYYFQKNSGQGVARNLGVSKAKGDIIVLSQDDIIATREFLSEHLKIHLRHTEDNEAALGFTAWDPRLTITPIMRWMTNGSSIFGKFGGHQFAYEKLKGKKDADFNFFYTSNISLKKRVLEKYPFDPSFAGYGWEDIELGYRLHKRIGLKIKYNSKAIAYHYHVMTQEDMRKRMITIGKSAWIFHRKYPELEKVPKGMKKLLMQILASGFSIYVLKLIRDISQGYFSDIYYYALSKKYYLQGIKSKI